MDHRFDNPDNETLIRRIAGILTQQGPNVSEARVENPNDEGTPALVADTSVAGAAATGDGCS
jgi:hypothetical protein